MYVHMYICDLRQEDAVLLVGALLPLEQHVSYVPLSRLCP